MGKKPDSPLDRFKQVPLWQWGLIAIVAGIAANVVMGLKPPPLDSAAARGQAFGQGIATLLFVIVGVVLIVLHFIRRNRR